MELKIIMAEQWKIDGGVCFGVVPKTLWGKHYAADEQNLLDIYNRLLLIEDGDRKILIDTGFGNKKDEKYYGYKYIQTTHSLSDALEAAGVSSEEITDVVFTHLHDDHCGGASYRNAAGEVLPLFPKADYWLSKEQWEWALNPNAREIGAYFKENLEVLAHTNRLHFVQDKEEFLPNIEARLMHGHTRGQLIPLISYGEKKLVYTADFIPSVAHIPIPYVAAVDIEPLAALKEKEAFLQEAVEKDYILFFEHDAQHEACTLEQTAKGIRIKESIKLHELTKILSNG